MDEGHIHLRINIKCMYALGVFKSKFSSKALTVLYNWFYSNFVIGYLIWFVIAQYIEVFNILDSGLVSVVSNLGVTLLYSDTICKVFVCNSTKIYKLVEQIRETEVNLLSYKNKHLEDIFYRHVRWNYLADKLLIWIGVFTVLPFYVSPILEQMSKDYQIERAATNDTTQVQMRPLPFSSWFPFNRYKYYFISYSYHILAGIIGGSLTVSTDIFFVGLMTFAIGQIKILQYSFKNASSLARNLSRNGGISYEDAIFITIQKFVQRHKIIIEYVWTLDGAMRALMLFDFAIASLQMAMLGLQIVVSGFGWQQMFALEYLFAMFVQLFLFYWHANEIVLESLGIATAIWESDWIEYGEDVKKKLMVVMMRSQKPLTLSVGPFYVMSTQTALSILRAAYSYVVIIRQMYMRK